MDELAEYNRERWEALARANVEWSQPFTDLDPATAQRLLDPHGLLGDCRDKAVLCLASGGGQQSAAFGLLGARVTVLDLSDTQLARDREMAHKYGFKLRAEQGDMRDLSRFHADTFDVVWQPFSINFVPQVAPVFEEVARVIRTGGRYYVEAANPFTFYSVDQEAWDGLAYPLKFAYCDGQEITQLAPAWSHWDVEGVDGHQVKILGPKEFRHNLATIVNTLSRSGFVIQGLWEELTQNEAAEPGSWEHFKSLAPPWFKLWTLYLPGTLK